MKNTALDLLPGDHGYVPPSLDSHDNISLALAQLYTALWAEKIDEKQVRLSLQLISLAQRTLKSKAQEATHAAKAALHNMGALSRAAGVPSSAAVGEGGVVKKVEGEAARKPPQPVAPAYKGPRYYDPYGCMPKE